MKAELERDGHILTDHGSYTPDPVDFPDIAKKRTGKVILSSKIFNKRGVPKTRR